MIMDEGIMEKEDCYILDRMKEFILSEEVSRFSAAKQLLILIERAVRYFFLAICSSLSNYSSNAAKGTSKCLSIHRLRHHLLSYLNQTKS